MTQAATQAPAAATTAAASFASPEMPGALPEPKTASPESAAASSSSPRKVRLHQLACARSGDKGDNVNIGVIARSDAMVPALRAALTVERVQAYFAHLVKGTVRRHEMPGMRAFNFVLTEALDGGGTRSLRNDSQGKTFAQMLLDIEFDVPANIEVRERPPGPDSPA